MLAYYQKSHFLTASFLTYSSAARLPHCGNRLLITASSTQARMRNGLRDHMLPCQGVLCRPAYRLRHSETLMVTNWLTTTHPSKHVQLLCNSSGRISPERNPDMSVLLTFGYTKVFGSLPRMPINVEFLGGTYIKRLDNMILHGVRNQSFQYGDHSQRRHPAIH